MIRTLLSSENADGGTNRNRYKNPKMDALINAASATAEASTSLWPASSSRWAMTTASLT